jgi:hypothetical protein
MGKTERHRQDLQVLLNASGETIEPAGSGVADLRAYLVANSALPGRRANLELAAAFSDVVADHAAAGDESVWELCANLTSISAEEAPVNAPEEFLPFCGAQGLGAIGAVVTERFDAALGALQRLASDPRWRTREAVCFGLQRLLVRRRDDTLEALRGWVGDGHFLEMRAAAAAVAEPALLTDYASASTALQLHRMIFDQVLAAKDRRAEDFGTLRKGLAFTLSVVVHALPDEGFAYVGELARSQDPDVMWILSQNLRKNRLVKNHPREVAAMRELLL